MVTTWKIIRHKMELGFLLMTWTRSACGGVSGSLTADGRSHGTFKRSIFRYNIIQIQTKHFRAIIGWVIYWVEMFSFFNLIFI